MSDTYRGWSITFDYGYFNAIGPNFDASWEGEEDGWVGNGEQATARTLDELHAEIDFHIEGQRQAQVVKEAEAGAPICDRCGRKVSSLCVRSPEGMPCPRPSPDGRRMAETENTGSGRKPDQQVPGSKTNHHQESSHD